MMDLYQKYVAQAKARNIRFLCMVGFYYSFGQAQKQPQMFFDIKNSNSNWLLYGKKNSTG